ncbi:MAG: hypothetical protein ACYC7D_10685 [Nitrososphaerales archaeon]
MDISRLKKGPNLRLILTCLLAASSLWFLAHAISDLFYHSSPFFLFEGTPEIFIRLGLGACGIIATAFQAYYWKKSIVDKESVKLAINHYVRNRMQFLTLALELYQSDPSPENLAVLSQAKLECEQLVREVDLIVQERLHAPKTVQVIPETRL